jgi:hypothetical protein
LEAVSEYAAERTKRKASLTHVKGPHTREAGLNARLYEPPTANDQPAHAQLKPCFPIGIDRIRLPVAA